MTTLIEQPLEDQAAVVRRLSEQIAWWENQYVIKQAELAQLRTVFKEFLSTHGCMYPAECSDCDDAHKAVGK